MTKKIREIVKTVLHMKGEPKEIALAFAIGVFIAFFPIFGTHTIMALGGAWLLGLSPAIALAGTLVNNPWTIAFVYGSSLYVGLAITGKSLGGLEINWSEINMDMIVELAKLLLIPFTVGCLLLGIIAAVVSYIIALKAVISYRNRRQRLPQEAEGGT